MLGVSPLDAFFGHPTLRKILEEADTSKVMSADVTSDDDPVPGEEKGQDQTEDGAGNLSDQEIQKLAADFKDKHLTQDDIVNMYKSGKLNKTDVKNILSLADEGSGQDGQGGQGGQGGQEQGPSEEELFAQQIEQTNDLFIKFTLYDKTNDLMSKLNYFQENFSDASSDLYDKVIQLKEFLNVLSNLVFTVETTVAYQMYGSILLQLTELFNEYQAKQTEQTKERKPSQQTNF